jgi:hypothetical protein
MTTQGFNFLSYSAAIERMMQEWYAYTHHVLHQSSDLGFAREYFVNNILASFLPKSVIVGIGEIIDGEGNRSGQQDVIIYRADFPIITSLTPVNAYLAEGVVATIEVKSNLSTGTPNHLLSAFKNVQKVHSLFKQAFIISGSTDEVEKLQEATRIKTYVVGYSGWKEEESFVRNYTESGKEVNWTVPHLVCQPGFCLLRNDGFINPDNQGIGSPPYLLHYEHPFAVFLHHLLKSIMINTSGSVVSVHGINAVMNYDLGRYFNFDPPLRFKPLY